MPEDAEPVQAVARMRGGRTERELVAVVGMGCVMPDAPDVPTFWKNIQEGKNSIREVPKDRWDPDLFYADDRTDSDKTYTKIGAFVEEVPFNGIEFRIPPKVAQTLDGVQKMAILATAQALKDSGYDKKEFDRSRCAVILGQAMGGEIQRATSTRVQVPTFLKALNESDAFRTLPADQRELIGQEFGDRAREHYPAITEDTMPGELANVVAGRIANVFNLSGANYTTDAACASSLAAIDAAVKSLQEGEYDMVVTGGADRSMDIATYVKFCRIGALSATGSYPFDARADGFVMGEGAGILILKRLSDALRDGDKVYAVVRGVGSSSDGKGKGITAPNIDGQIKAVRRAFDHAGIDPATVELIECHGTSTRVGDVVEVDALSKIWSESAAPQSVAIGSVKSQIGHLKSAAGAAGLIKSALALKEQTLPPSINFETPNPKIDWGNVPFYVNTEAKPWPDAQGDEPRRAAVSSFGFGGTNFHVILEEYVPGKTQATAKSERAPEPAAKANGEPKTPVTDVIMKRKEPETSTVPQEPPAAEASTEVVVLGAPTHEAVLAKIDETKALLASGQVDDANFADFCFQTSNANVEKPVRVAVVATGPDDLVKKLDQAPTAIKEPKTRIAFAARGIYVGEGTRQGKLAMLFPGQGSQYTDMLRDMATRYRRVRQTYSEADRVMKPFLGDPLTKFIFLNEDNGVDREAAEESLRRTEICQPAMLAADLALYRLLGDHGVKPEVVAGHSLGEYGALVAAGVLSLEDALVAVSARGREMANVHVPDLGKMASVSADAETVAKNLESVDGYVIPANKNCKVQTVIAGGSDAVDAAVEMFNKQGIQAQHINVSAAFHSEIVAPAREPFANVLRKIDIKAPKVPILTNVTADYYPSDGDVKDDVIDILTQQIAAPVEWQKQVRRMFDDGARVFIEVGPKRTLTAFCGNVLEGEQFFAAATNHPKKGGFWHFHDALALMAAWGYPVKFPDPLDGQTTTEAFRAGKRRYEPPSAKATTSAPAPTAAASNGPRAVGGDEADAIVARVKELGLNLDRLLITGVGLGTPGKDKAVFSDDNIDRMLEGKNHIEPLDESTRRGMVDKNIVRLVKSATGDHRFETIHDLNNVLHLMGQSGDFDLGRDFGIDQELIKALDVSSALAIASGIEALRDAGIPLVQSMVKTTTGKFLPGGWVLPVPLQEETGVVFASAFPGHVRLIETISDYFASKNAGASFDELAEIYAEAIQTVRDTEVRRKLTDWFTRHVGSRQDETTKEDVFEFNRRFLFHVLSMGHSQLAQLIKAKGPNTQVNSACSSTTMALSIAEDWIRTGRCKRVLVVGGDDITQEPANAWFGAGFLAAGAATTEKKVEDAALPFDRRRHGMIVGMGGVGLVLEAEEEVKARGQEGIVEVIANVVANSAFHGSRLDTDHVATIMDRLMDTVEERLGVSRSEIAKDLLFMSHETYTPARGGSAAAEILALRRAFAEDANQVVISNTKGFTGHPMGASIEDAIAVKSLQRGRVPPIANLKEPDPELGDLNLSKGGEYDVKYALRLSAGFGSQIGMTFLKLRSRDEKRIVEPTKYQAWLTAMSGQKKPELEVVNRTLRVKSTMNRPMQAAETAKPQPAPKEPEPVPAAPTPTPTVPAAGSSQDDIRERLLDLFAEKTGYPKDMLEPDLDLEADLGIDTVKQAELFGELREHYGLPQEEGLQLKDYPTINRIVEYIHSRLGDGAQPAPTPTSSAKAEEPAAEAAPAAESAASTDEVRERLLDLFAEKTGYPKDMLEPDLDLEADLGIDTVKQAELFGELREHYGLPQEEGLQLKDYPTINRIVEYIQSRLAGGAAPATTPASETTPSPQPETLTPTTAPEPETTPSPMPTTAETPASTAAGDADRDEILDRLLELFAEKTGYPKDMLEPDLDLEADLGIDTVKQAELFGELREHYGLPQEEGLQLKDYPTINRIVDYIASRLGGTETPATPEPTDTAPAEPEESTPVEPPTPEAPTAPDADGDGAAVPTEKAEALETVTALVAEKTGYPADLLEPDLDLEADLGIDTVKQAEIFGEVRERFGIPPVEGIQISDYPTLDRVAQFVVEHGNGNGAASKSAPAAAEAVTAPEATTDARPAKRPDASATTRFVVRYAPVGHAGEPDPEAVKDQRLLLYAPGADEAAADALTSAGARVETMDALPETVDEAEERVAGWTQDGPIDGIVFLLPDPVAGSAVLPEEGDGLVRGAFHLVKALLSGDHTIKTFGVSTALGGDFGFSRETPIDPTHGAVAGFAKAVQREVPDARVRVLDVAPGTEPSTRTKILVQELGRTGGPVEVGTRDGRGTLRLFPEETVEEETGLDLDTDDVLLVPGGAQGITSEIVKALAREYQCKFILLGRTELVDQVERLAELGEDELAEKKQEIIDAMKARGERPTPVAVEKEFSKTTKSIEAHRTVAACKAAGADALYVAGDVLDTDDVANAVELGTKLFGPVTAIIHAAGVEESKQIVDKKPESFALVYDVKVRGARNLLAATEDQPVAAFVTFASVAGRFGNAGQADYSAANDALAKLSLRLRQDRGDEFAATTIDWSAWADKGMATRGSIMTVLESIGVTPIPLDQGVARFLDEIAHGTRDPEIVVAAQLGKLADEGALEPPEPAQPSTGNGDGAAKTRTKPPVATKKTDGGQQVLVVDKEPSGTQAGLLGEVTERSDDRIVARLHLDADEDPYLDDHAIDGTPYLPGVFGVEAFAQAAAHLAADGQRFVGVRDMEYLLPLKLLRRRPVDATIVCQVSDQEDGVTEVDCRLESQFVNAQGQALGAPKLHFTGTLIFAADAPAEPKKAQVPDATRTAEASDVYERFFHGPSFQVLAGLDLTDDDAVAVGRFAWPSAPLMGASEKAASLATAPLVRELAFQTAGGHGIFQHDRMALPRRIGRSRFYGTADEGEEVVAVATFKRTGDGVSVYDVVVQTADGRVLETLTDYEMIHTDAPVGATTAPSDVATYRSRWGHDLPVPLDGARAVLVNDDEIRELDVSPASALTEGERKDQERYRNDKRSREFFLGRLAAKEAVALLLGRPVKEARGVEIRRLETGRPEVQSQHGKDVLVTISHQGPYAVALAVNAGDAVKNVGVDFDKIEPKGKGFETESFTEDEIALIDAHEKSGGDRAEMQLRLWTIKEAVLKALGQGFALSLKSVRVTSLDGDDVTVELGESARACLDDFDAEAIDVDSWTRDNYAYALAWLH